MLDNYTIDDVFDPTSVHYNGAISLSNPPSASTSTTGDPQSQETLSQTGLSVPVITVDPTGSIQDAFDKLNELGGGIINLLAGTYTVKTALVGHASITLKGISPSATTIDFASTSANLSFSGVNVYTTGTITSISGAVNVTGSGTLWLANASAGQSLFIGTRWYTIAAVTGNTTLILAEAYGDNITMPGAAYRIATVLRDFTISNLTLKSSTGTALVVIDCRQYFLNDVLLLSNNIGYSATNISEEVITQLIAAANTSDGVQLTNIGISDIRDLNCIGNGGNGLTINTSKSVLFVPMTADSNTGDGVNITSSSDTELSGEFSSNGSDGIEIVTGATNINISKSNIKSNTANGVKFNLSTSSSTITQNLGTADPGGTFGKNSANLSEDMRAQKFTTIGSGNVTSISICCAKVGSPGAHAILQIWSDAAGVPSAKIGSNSTPFLPTVTYTGGAPFSTPFTVTFPTPVPVSASTAYWVVYTRDNAFDNSNNYVVDQGDLTGGTTYVSQNSAWVSSSVRAYNAVVTISNATSTDCKITTNEIHDNGTYGIDTSTAANNIILGNHFSGNSTSAVNTGVGVLIRSNYGVSDS